MGRAGVIAGYLPSLFVLGHSTHSECMMYKVCIRQDFVGAMRAQVLRVGPLSIEDPIFVPPLFAAVSVPLKSGFG